MKQTGWNSNPNNQNANLQAPARAGAFAVWQALQTLLRSPWLLAALLAAALCGYAGMIFDPAVDMDDLALATYQQGGEFLRQGRITVWLLQALFGIMRQQAVLPGLFAALSLCAAGLVLAAALYTAAQRPVCWRGALLLCGGLLLWPYHAEVLMYANQCGIGFGYLLCAVALALVLPHQLAGGHWRGALGAGVCLCFALGLYESFAPVWLTLVCAAGLAAARAAAPYTCTAKQTFARLVRGVWPLALALVLRAGAKAALCAALGVQGGNDTASKTIFWLQRASLKDALLIPLREFLETYLARAFGVPALALLLLACVTLLVWVLATRFGNGKTLWALGLVLAQFSLGILQGTGSVMARASQCFAVFVPFVAWLLLQPLLDAPKQSGAAPRLGAAVLAVALLAVEGASLADTFSLNQARWQYEQQLLQNTAAQLTALDADGTLPVAFCGEVQLSPELAARITLPAASPAYKFSWVINTLLGGAQGDLYRYENPQTLVINWAQTAFGSNAQIYALMDYIGHPCQPATPEQQTAANTLAQTLPPGVTRQDGYLLVVLG